MATPCADPPINLGSLSGSVSVGTGVSADGTVAAGYGYTGSAYHAFRWSGGVMTDLGTLGGSSSFTNYGGSLSSDGSVVVGHSNITGNTAYHAFRWSGGVMSDLGTLGGTNSYAFGTNSDGSVVVGQSYITGDGAVHAFRWSGGVMTDLDTLGGTYSVAFSTSGDGSVVVGYSNITGNSAYHAFRWSGGVMTDLGTLGGTDSHAFGTNSDGSVVVGQSSIIGDGATHAFRWSGGVMTDLGTLGGTYSAAYGTSGNGSVVVGESYTTGGAAVHAFRWTAPTGMKDLNTLLTDAGVNMSGITLVSAHGVSQNGQFIVGYGDFSGAQRGYIVRYDDGIGGLTTTGSVQSSINDLADTRFGLMAQQHGFAAPLLGGNAALGLGNEAGVFVTGGSAAGGGFVRYGFGTGLSLLAGLSYAQESYADADLKHAGMGALALRYMPTGKGWLHPFFEAGGWYAPNTSLSFSRTYDNGAGTATGTGTTQGDLSYAYARAGLLLAANRSNQVALSAEIGRQRLATDAYTEALTAANPFPANVTDGADTTDLAKLRLQWSHRFGAHLDGTLWAAAVHGFNRSSKFQATVAGVGTLQPADLDAQTWAEYGVRIGYKLTDAATLDVFANGVSGADGIDTRVHTGVGVRFQF